MTRESRIITALARSAERRRMLGRVLLGLAAVCLLVALTPLTWSWAARALLPLLVVTLIAVALRFFRPHRAPTALDYALHLDAQFPELEDSTSLLFEEIVESPLAPLQQNKVRKAFTALEERGQLTNSIPAFPWRTVGMAWTVAAVGILLATILRAAPSHLSTTSDANMVRIERGTVALRPPQYVGAEPSTIDSLDFDTFEDTEVTWQITLQEPAKAVQLVFHDGETLALEKQTSRRWYSPTWHARSSVYRVVVDNEDITNGVFRIAAQPDLSPRIQVSEPQQSVRLLTPGSRESLDLLLQFEVTDDYGITATQARVTLARGNGEQVEFREEAVTLNPQWSNSRRTAAISHELDLIALGMEPGDELYVFAEALDNRAPTPNVGASQTYIVRWPGQDDATSTTVASLAVPVLPEFFRSQRQIIIDTEKLIADHGDIDEASFAQRAQSLAIDQKLLRLRYGQYLGEEDDSGIGIATQISSGEDSAEDDLDDHDHAEHADEPTESGAPTVGDAQAVIDLTAHMHDQEEQATLFEPATRELLRRALAQMWDAELQLRLAQPDTALPFEYAALGFIKEVQQSSRIYLRRTGFRPTPVDEERRLTGELDEITSRQIDNDPRSASQDRRLRLLLDALTHVTATVPSNNELSKLTDIVRTRALNEPSWLPALGAMERLQRDNACGVCIDEITRELWRQLNDTLPAPSAQPNAKHPMQRAYDTRRQQSTSGAHR